MYWISLRSDIGAALTEYQFCQNLWMYKTSAPSFIFLITFLYLLSIYLLAALGLHCSPRIELLPPANSGLFPALVDRFLTHEPPGKSLPILLKVRPFIRLVLVLPYGWVRSCTRDHTVSIFIKIGFRETSLAAQRLKLCASTAGGTGSTPSQETEILQASWGGKKKKKIGFRTEKSDYFLCTLEGQSSNLLSEAI